MFLNNKSEKELKHKPMLISLWNQQMFYIQKKGFMLKNICFEWTEINCELSIMADMVQGSDHLMHLFSVAHIIYTYKYI